MSEQMQAFQRFVEQAKAGNPDALKLVREICRRSVDVAPDRDILLIAEAIIGLNDQFSPAASNSLAK